MDKEKIVDAVAKSIWEAKRKQEIKNIEKFGFDPQIFSNAGLILSQSSPRETVIVSYSLISKALDSSIRFHFSHVSEKEVSALFDGLGPLTSDATKTRIAKALGWLPENIATAVDTFRKLRNRLSHDIGEFTSSDLRSNLTSDTVQFLEESIERIIASLDGDYTENDSGKTIDLVKIKSYGCFGIVLAQFVMLSIVSGPSRLRLGMENHVKFWEFDEGPEWTRVLMRKAAGALLDCSLVPVVE